MIITLLLVILIFSALVFVHELGHFWAARRNGVEVEEFGFGFPPRLVGKQVGPTLYSLNLIPLGGFVKLKGEDLADHRPGSFGAANTWIKTKIMLAGVGMNALLAYVLLLVLCVVGLPAAFTSGFSLPQPTSSSSPQVMVLEVGSGTPGAAAGLARGDIIISANGQVLKSEADLTNFTRDHAGQAVHLVVRQRGAAHQLTVPLRGRVAGKTSGYLGVVPAQVYSLRFGWKSIWVAASLTAQMIWLTLVGVVSLFGHLPALVAGIFHGGVPAAADGVAGPIGIFSILSNISVLGLGYLTFFVTTISVALAVFNIIPIPVLDGGKLALIWLQNLMKRPLSTEAESRIYLVSFALLGVLVLVVSLFDIRRL